ncbi:MAG: cation-translocating P-type ATPase [Spiroplasma poulsonii]|uniref:Copper-exporting P-type ATPase A n=1 Tax=Spiroplasma poulsonii TaxID=2138 RepID=A0A2P6FBZ7_9MOLU|nr:cation-translocating P-type ATPase [Spiroplasma poulsonii]KAF0851395.1 Copper-exporting P-type ATPase A [Spiroplasma poulsonii]MBW1241731.1 cation-translocating P-type ATPase [Spiroplasma poulsonii]PQM30989.1 Copper-exporting P-type ATPase A [Spiroplasma poulsonii]PWF95984.1 Copper-exporting P-type ATPase A [Spiroplasma poulsonii]PWF98760.1 Copper-exporting P-type ATPase A [Spiroplasma poulsonii]
MKKPLKTKLTKRQIRDLYELIIAIILNLPLLLGMIPSLSILHNQWLQLTLATIILFYCGRRYYINMFNEIFRWHLLGMNTLIGLGTLLSYGYSIYLIASHSSYMLLFETAGTIIMIMLLGNIINTNVQRKVTAGIESVITLQVDQANRVDPDQTLTVINTKDVQVDNILLIKKGEKVPVDGVVQQGTGYLNEAMLNCWKKLGVEVIGGTVNMGEPFYLQAKKVGADTVLANILQKVDEIQSQKLRIQRIADQIAKWFTPLILIVAVITFLCQYFIFHKGDVAKGIDIAITVIVISCPCALGLATPLAVAVGFGKALKEGVVFNNTSAFEKINKINAVAFDKTGTITTGELTVQQFLGDHANSKYIYHLEKLSAHPIAKSIVNFFPNEQSEIKFQQFKEEAGRGLSGVYNNSTYQIMSYQTAVKKDFQNLLAHQVASLTVINPILIAFVINETITNVLVLTDIIRSDASITIAKFAKKHIATHMISGDNEETTKAIATEVGIASYYVNVAPLTKATIVESIQATGQVTAYVGDGINDLVALKQADFAIATGQGSEVAIQNSDITIIKPNIFNIYKVFVLTKLTRRLIWWNFFWAFIYNLITIPLAILGIIPPLIGAVVMGASQLLVLLNSLVFNNLKVKFK